MSNAERDRRARMRERQLHLGLLDQRGGAPGAPTLHQMVNPTMLKHYYWLCVNNRKRSAPKRISLSWGRSLRMVRRLIYDGRYRPMRIEAEQWAVGAKAARPTKFERNILTSILEQMAATYKDLGEPDLIPLSQ